ncbi:MAG: FGGY-family carbohydrate kinase [Acidimicrobiales bacterium]
MGGGAIDALGEQAVAGADEVGDVLVIFGATLITWCVLDEWATVPGLWTLPHTAPGRSLIGGPSTAGSMFIDRVDRWAAPVEQAELESLDPADLPIWLPYARGERCPLHRRDLRAELHDAALHHGPAAIRWAAYEASGFVVRRLLDLAAPAGAAPTRIVATGGGTRSEGWMHAIADATGLPVDVVAVPEGAALGSAFMARCVAGLEPSDSPWGPSMADGRRWARTSHRVEPDERWVGPASRRYERFLELSDAAVRGTGSAGPRP